MARLPRGAAGSPATPTGPACPSRTGSAGRRPPAPCSAADDQQPPEGCLRSRSIRRSPARTRAPAGSAPVHRVRRASPLVFPGVDLPWCDLPQDQLGHRPQLLRGLVLRLGEDELLGLGALPSFEAGRQRVQRLTDRLRLTHSDPPCRGRITYRRSPLQPASRPHGTRRLPRSLLTRPGHPVLKPCVARTHRGPGLISLSHQHRRQCRHLSTDVTDLVDPPQPILVRRHRPIRQSEILKERADPLEVTAHTGRHLRGGGRRECCLCVHVSMLNERTDK